MISLYESYLSNETIAEIRKTIISNIISSAFLMELCRMYDIDPRNVSESSLERLADYIARKKNITIEQAAIKIWLGEYWYIKTRASL